MAGMLCCVTAVRSVHMHVCSMKNLHTTRCHVLVARGSMSTSGSEQGTRRGGDTAGRGEAAGSMELGRGPATRNSGEHRQRSKQPQDVQQAHVCTGGAAQPSGQHSTAHRASPSGTFGRQRTRPARSRVALQGCSAAAGVNMAWCTRLQPSWRPRSLAALQPSPWADLGARRASIGMQAGSGPLASVHQGDMAP